MAKRVLSDPERHALYSELLDHFIRDVRKDPNAPKMPFVIGVLGLGGLNSRSRDSSGTCGVPLILNQLHLAGLSESAGENVSA
jgi:hypothetical protein